ncbi:MAG: F0F1 ATP synthase subunit delta [bacterium]
MLIDWFTVGAQALNFLILVWLLKRLLYRPILRAIDAREKRIATALTDAAAKQAAAKKERDEFQHKNEEFDGQRAALLDQAVQEAKAERLRLLNEARQAAEAFSARRQETLRTDARNLSQAVSRRMQQEVFSTARKALEDLAGANVEESIGNAFVQRLRDMDRGTKDVFGAALASAASPAIVRSAFELTAAQQAAIQAALDELFPPRVNVHFETAPELIGGVELTANGQKLAWSIADYLVSLEKSLDELLTDQPANAKARDHGTAPNPAARMP